MINNKFNLFFNNKYNNKYNKLLKWIKYMN